MPDPTYLIKKISVNGHEHELSALYIQDGNANKTWQDILDLVENIGFEILVWPDGTQFPPHNPATVDDFTAYRNNIVLVKDATATSDECVEYVITRTQTGGTAEEPVYVYDWERIGTTTTDLSDYAKKGGYVTLGPSTNSTGAAGAATLTTTSDGAQTATGTATVTFAQTTITSKGGMASQTATTSAAGAHTINGSNFTFTGATATIAHNAQGNVQIDKHKFTPTGSVTGSQVVNAHSHGVNITWDTLSYITEASAQEDGLHTHTINTHFHTATYSVVAGLKTETITAFNTGGSMTLTSNTGFNTPTVTAVMYNPSVVDHVLKWDTITANASTTYTFTPATGTPKDVVVGVDTWQNVAGVPTAIALTAAYAGSHTHSITFTTATVSIPTSITLNTTGGHTIYGSNFGVAMSAIELAHNQVATDTVDYNSLVAAVTVDDHVYTPSGSIGGSVSIADHTHSYQAPAIHTHEVVIPTKTLTGTAAVAVTSHTHNVTLGNHTHDLGEHTHRVNIFTPVVTVPYNSARD